MQEANYGLLSSLHTLTLLLNLGSFFLLFSCVYIGVCMFMCGGVHTCEHSCRAPKSMSENFLSYSSILFFEAGTFP